MKRFILLFIGIVFWVGNANAAYPTINNDYQSFYGFYDDFYKDYIKYYRGGLKHWVMYYQLTNGGYTKEQISIDSEDKIIDGQTYAQITWEGSYTGGNPIDTLFYRQEGDRVYCRVNAGDEERLILDYGLNVGDTFVGMDGERFAVTGMENPVYFPPVEDEWGDETLEHWEYDSICIYGSEKPKILRLRSENDGHEDIWVEGMGSLYWGIVPLSVANGLGCLPANSTKAQVMLFCGFYSFGDMGVNEDNCKLQFFKEKKYEGSYALAWQFAFSGDTLCVRGLKELIPLGLASCVECAIEGDNVDISIEQLPTMFDFVTTKPYCLIDVKIPGFKAGTYQVGLEGGAHQTLVCNPTNGITLTSAVSQGEGGVYDLSGRKISDNSNSKIQNSKLTKGIYIVNGKKVLVK